MYCSVSQRVPRIVLVEFEVRILCGALVWNLGIGEWRETRETREHLRIRHTNSHILDSFLEAVKAESSLITTFRWCRAENIMHKIRRPSCLVVIISPGNQTCGVVEGQSYLTAHSLQSSTVDTEILGLLFRAPLLVWVCAFK